MDNTELELRRIASQAERARAIIEDPLLVDAFERVRLHYMDAWLRSPPEAADFREATYHHILALDEVRLELNRVLSDGTMARAALEERRTGTDTP